LLDSRAIDPVSPAPPPPPNFSEGQVGPPYFVAAFRWSHDPRATLAQFRNKCTFIMKTQYFTRPRMGLGLATTLAHGPIRYAGKKRAWLVVDKRHTFLTVSTGSASSNATVAFTIAPKSQRRRRRQNTHERQKKSRGAHRCGEDRKHCTGTVMWRERSSTSHTQLELCSSRPPIEKNHFLMVSRVVHFLALFAAARACTNIIVTSSASNEGGALLGDNDDTAKRFGAVTHFEAATWPPGSTRNIFDFETSVFKGVVPDLFCLPSFNILHILL
jgi:hypothetical protein